MATKLLRRGFKKEAEALSDELRGELGLCSHDPIDVFTLADHLAIPILPLSGVSDFMSEEAINHFLNVEPDVFSGITIHAGPKRLVLFNDGHAPVRINSTVAHELSHALLFHPPSELANELGNRNRNPVIEAEANWLAGVILVPQAAAVRIALGKIPMATAADDFAVSTKMLNYRLQVSGANAIASRVMAKSRKTT